MHRKISTFLLAVLLILSGIVTVSAESFDPEQTGSISVTLAAQPEGEPMVGAVLQVYYVASVGINNEGNLTYRYTDDFAESGIDLKDPELAAKLEAFVTQKPLAFVEMITDASGTARSGELALGLYFVRQTGAVDGFAPCTPFLVTVPSREENGYVYHVNASPKTEAAKLIDVTINVVWNTDGSVKIPESATVQLLRDGEVVQTAVLNAQNNWQMLYTNMPQSDAYSVMAVSIPNGFTATYTQKGYVFTVIMTATLAQTGQLVWPIPVLTVSGMLLLAVGFLLLRKKREVNG